MKLNIKEICMLRESNLHIVGKSIQSDYKIRLLLAQVPNPTQNYLSQSSRQKDHNQLEYFQVVQGKVYDECCKGVKLRNKE